jgi:hypothetical protein
MSHHTYASIYSDYAAATDQCFDRLMALDPELCGRLLEVLGTREASIAWLMTHKYDGALPIHALIASRRSDLFDALVRLEHTVY